VYQEIDRERLTESANNSTALMTIMHNKIIVNLWYEAKTLSCALKGKT